MTAEFEVSRVFGARLQRSVLAPLVEPFVLSMTRSKYAQASVHRYVAALAHLACWMVSGNSAALLPTRHRWRTGPSAAGYPRSVASTGAG